MSALRYIPIERAQLPSSSFPRKLLYIRIAGYVALEGAFLVLAALALLHPLAISTFLSQTDGKAVFTVAFIAWHFLATHCLQAIIQHIFASEWQYIIQRSNALIPGATDRASTLVSGFLDFIPHFFTQNASRAFRLALPAQLICLAISGLLPGTVVFTSVQMNSTIPLQVANLTSLTSSNDLELGQSRAELIVRVEIRENSTFGLGTQENWVVGWPQTSENFDYSITYPTDVVHYNFKCHWEAPEFISSDTFQSSGGAQWVFLEGYSLNDGVRTVPLPPVYRVVSQALPSQGTGNLIAFLFFGSNETYPVPSTVYSWGTILNLDGIPATYNASGFFIQPISGENYNATASLATLLVCDPQLHISSGQAVIWPNRTLSVVESSLNTSARIGNFPDADVITWFTTGQREVIQNVPNQDSAMVFENSMLNYNSAFMFLNDSSLSNDLFLTGQKGIITLPIDQIQKNLNTVYKSIAKAFSDGVRRDSEAGGVFAQDTTPVQAVTSRLVKTLVTNISLFYIAVALVTAELLIIGALCYIRDWQTRVPLDLESIFATIGREAIITREPKKVPLDDSKSDIGSTFD